MTQAVRQRGWERAQTPFAAEHERSLQGRASRGVMPKDINALLRWYAEAWQAEVPERLHVVEVWFGPQERDRSTGEARWPTDAVGGSRLGTPKHADGFRRYLENYASEVDEDGYYLRPVHAALGRLGRRDPWMARCLFALAQSGYRWRAVADSCHWVHEMFLVYIEEALRRLWREHAEHVVRMT